MKQPDRPDDDWAAEIDWPDDVESEIDWPDDPEFARDERWPSGEHWPPRSVVPARPRLLRLAVVAVVALSGGAAAALAVRDISSGSAPAAAEPSASATSGGQSQQGVTGSMMVVGRVTAVSAHSVTVSAAGHSVTARVTGSTSLSGSVTAISGVRVNDMVAVQISESNGVATVTALQDPASVSG
jgi:hypothetical protein